MTRIAVIGECMVELYTNKKGLYKQTFGGDTFNCSVYLKRSFKKANVEYITVLGNDNFSKKMIKFFKKENINTSYVDILKNKNPGLYMINTKNGERTFNYWREDSAAKKLFLTSSFNKMSKDFLNYDLIYLSAITLAIMSEKGRNKLYKILKKARASGVKVAFDSNYRARLYKNSDDAKKIYNKAIQHCDIFLPSFDDEKELWGEIDIKSIIEKAINAGCSEIVIKCGKKDIVYYENEKTNTIKTKELTNIVDSTSAGDSFNGEYLGSRLKGKSIEGSIKEAIKLATKVIMHQGAIIPKGNNE